MTRSFRHHSAAVALSVAAATACSGKDRERDQERTEAELARIQEEIEHRRAGSALLDLVCREEPAADALSPLLDPPSRDQWFASGRTVWGRVQSNYRASIRGVYGVADRVGSDDLRRACVCGIAWLLHATPEEEEPLVAESRTRCQELRATARDAAPVDGCNAELAAAIGDCKALARSKQAAGHPCEPFNAFELLAGRPGPPCEEQLRHIRDAIGALARRPDPEAGGPRPPAPPPEHVTRERDGW